MNIGIIGAGRIGGNLVRLLTARGHAVAIANSRGPDTLADLAAETGAVASDLATVADGVDIAIVTIPQKFVADLPSGVLDRRTPDAPVIDTGNYYPWARDGRIADGLIAEIEDGLTDSEWTARQLGVPVVKAFNGILWSTLTRAARPAGAPDRIALPVAGDDPVAKAKVMALIDDIGFDPVDAGTLAQSWRLHPGKPAYGADADVAGLRAALAAATPQRPREWRAAGAPSDDRRS
ncbi:NADPH-dependent F420 reductase [Conexibacter sp. CPCC 206217]|uniref:NADPH-dependent F420 reductase n=1 Tax=Conexibacter sp. CPCC 206217 TaxID=3064574 RepID=UPI0027159CC1|nr:NAD(P)-binding domain-containing protein [Conexibacter sp. CPCC 206217]MDO8213974.1 NAD(P)-binding domain-containing protein [Conexibacter sp. CPCC 206217]